MDHDKAGGEVRKDERREREREREKRRERERIRGERGREREREREQEETGEQEARVKSKSQQESPWTSVVRPSASPASLFVRVRRRTRFPRTCTSGLADIHPVRVYLGPRVIYAMAQIKYFNRGGRATPKNRKAALRYSPTCPSTLRSIKVYREYLNPPSLFLSLSL